MDAKNTFVISYLHKAIKPLNQLRMIEDATVIYRISRAPERRIFYIDVGNLPKQKAEQSTNIESKALPLIRFKQLRLSNITPSL